MLTKQHRFSLPHWLLTMGLLCVSLSVSAQSDKTFAVPQPAPAAASTAGSLAQVTLSLLLVLAAVFAAAWLVQRLKGVGKFGSQVVAVIAEVGVGPKERAVLVQVGTQQLLLGVAPGSVRTLHVLSEPVSPTQAATQPLLAGAGAPDFKAIFRRSLGLKS